MRFFNIVAVAASLVSTAFAAPTPVQPAGAQVTMPTVAELEKAFSGLVPRNGALFYSGGTFNGARELQKNNPGKYVILADVWARNNKGYDSSYWQKIPKAVMAPAAAEREYDIRSSEALAKVSTGDVTVVLPDNWDPVRGKNAVWMTTEYPTLQKLMKNKIVTSIITKTFRLIKRDENTWTYLVGQDKIERA